MKHWNNLRFPDFISHSFRRGNVSVCVHSAVSKVECQNVYIPNIGFSRSRSWLNTLQANISSERALGRTGCPLVGPKRLFLWPVPSLSAFSSPAVRGEVQVVIWGWAIAPSSTWISSPQFLGQILTNCGIKPSWYKQEG